MCVCVCPSMTHLYIVTTCLYFLLLTGKFGRGRCRSSGAQDVTPCGGDLAGRFRSIWDTVLEPHEFVGPAQRLPDGHGEGFAYIATLGLSYLS